MQLIVLRRNFLFLYLVQLFYLVANGADGSPMQACSFAEIEQFFAAPVLISELTFTSDIDFDEQEFSYLSGLKIGQTVSAKDIKDAFFYLSLRQVFSKISLKFRHITCGVILKFELTGYQRLNNLSISGILFEKERYQQLYLMQVSPYFNLDNHLLAVKKIMQALKKDGYFNASIDSELKDELKTKLVNVNLKINPGRRFTIWGLTGNNFIVKLIKKRLLYKKYSANLLITELISLKKKLAKRGYPFAQISFKIFKNQAANKIKIAVEVALKHQLKYKFIGNYFFSDNDLFDYLIANTGSASHLPITLLIKDLSDLYQQQGFEQVEIKANQLTSGYEFLIEEGPRTFLKKDKKKLTAPLDASKIVASSSNKLITLGKTVLRGNTKMPFNYLAKFLPYQQGDLLDSQKLDETLFRIKKLDSFDAISIYPANEIDQLGHKPLIICLNTDHKFEFRTRLGFQKVSKNFAFQAGGTYKAGLSTLYKNITNKGDQLAFEADLTRFYRYIVAKYKRPIFMNVPLYFATNLYLNKYDQPIFIGSKDCLYHIYQQGLLVDIGYQGSILNFNVNMGIEGDLVSDISKEYARAIDFSDALLATKVPFLFIEPTLMIDYLDDKIDPYKGLFLLATLKGMIAIGSKQSYFIKILLEQSSFLPVTKTAVFAMRLSFGHILTDQFNVIMPIERFYLGGAYSVRSYEPDFAPPLGIVSTPECSEILVPQGGQTMLNACFELRLPIYQNLSGVLFQDLGALLKSGTSLGQGELLSATGFGLRYKTPVGPVRFDIGWRPKHTENIPNFAWFLTIGNAF